jgi:uncharacterized UBP type Zn finger protein
MSNNYNKFYHDHLNDSYNNMDNLTNSMKKDKLTTQDKLDYLIGKKDMNDLERPIYKKLSNDEQQKIIDKYSTDNLYDYSTYFNNTYNLEEKKDIINDFYQNYNGYNIKLSKQDTTSTFGDIDYTQFELPDNFYGKDVELKDNYLNMEITPDMVPIDVGLINTINSCYINSIIQIFLHNKLLYKRLLDWLFNNDYELPISKNIYDILIFLKLKFTKDRDYHKNFQCDSEEFLTWLLDKIDADKLFYVKFEHKIICNGCNYIKKFSSKDLSLHIKVDNESAILYKDEVINIVRLLVKQNFQDQLIDYKCDKCKHNKAIKIDKPISATKNLILNINAPKTKIRFYDYLDLFHDEDYEFELYGMIIHKGNDLSGHYLFYYFHNVDDEDDYCLCFNDTKVTIVKREKLLNGDLEKDESIRLVWYRKVDRRDLSDSSSSEDEKAKEA